MTPRWMREPPGEGSRWVFGGFWALLLAGTFLVAAPWAGFHGVLFACAGLLVALCPPEFRVPRVWWALAAVFLFAGAASFLPANWFGIPEWRRHLASLGVETGSSVAIQARQAAEVFAMFGIMLVTGLWLAGHRASPSQLRWWALAFTVGVAAYALASKAMQQGASAVPPAAVESHFGFFPNRNHTATYLAMGAVCGLGNVLQAIRDKRFVVMAVALAATGVCLWAVAGWSVSRGGVVLVAFGCALWLGILGWRYLGRHGIWAVGLMALATVGLFFIADSGVKRRITGTFEKSSAVIGSSAAVTPGKEIPLPETDTDLDFRIPTALDTLGLIRAFPWTGVGAGQFYSVFPQYKKLTIVNNDADSYHPESDWLWMAAEAGLPATFALLLLVMLAFRKSLLGIRAGRDRALRGACLVAALLVPVHGIFDVPGHRITLAWSAVLLYVLSLHAPASGVLPTSRRNWPFRGFALVLVAAAAFLIRAQWFGGPQPAFTAASASFAQARKLYAQDHALQQAAEAEGRKYQPEPAEDRLEMALATLDQAKPLAPLDRDLRRYEAFLAFHFDDKSDRIDRAFAIERALDPTWVAGPLRQADAWSATDPQRTATLWAEALRRAEAIDLLQPENNWSAARTLERIRQSARGKPGLEALVPATR